MTLFILALATLQEIMSSSPLSSGQLGMGVKTLAQPLLLWPDSQVLLLRHGLSGYFGADEETSKLALGFWYMLQEARWELSADGGWETNDCDPNNWSKYCAGKQYFLHVDTDDQNTWLIWCSHLCTLTSRFFGYYDIPDEILVYFADRLIQELSNQQLLTKAGRIVPIEEEMKRNACCGVCGVHMGLAKLLAMSPLGRSPKMNTDGVHGVRQVRIKMKSHRVRICGLVEEIKIRLEGQVELYSLYTRAESEGRRLE
ncbi:hypothetical protein EDD18DRAFT_1097996 [Armillaria luteobubalina]|uniref:Uncharacterized protein n=1 Tax=Armillaria luteobubalina TaxID=153913 RepID=A0AA39QRU8_9AGAR|nr:hypothetical protein EDD18DRAFT_1097996 [Armillaria luteobubalina]